MTPEVLADPIGVVVRLVARIEPQLGRAVIEEAVTSVAGGRAKRRKLAQARAGDRPSVLTDGRSPAPRAVGDLLIALRKAGARAVSPPACTECGKDLRTMQRRGQDWYCGVCGPVRLPCAACGKTGRVASRDRDEQPRCARCPPGGGQDPAEIVMNVVAAIDPALPAVLVSAAMTAAAPGAGQRRQLAWVLQDQPGLLTGAGAGAPVPSVLRLISELCDAGATRIIRPPCPRCGRVINLHRRIGGQWSCRNCVARSASSRAHGAEPSSRSLSVTSTAGHCARTAWSPTRPTRKSAPGAAGAARSASAPRTGLCARPARRSRR